MMMKKNLLMILLLSATLIVSCGNKKSDAENKTTATPGEQVVLKDTDVAITIEDTTITVGAVNTELNNYLKQFGDQVPKEQMDNMKQRIKDQIVLSFVHNILLNKAANQENISVEDTKVDERLNELKNRYPTPQDYEKWLAGIGKTEDQIKKEIKKGMGIQLLIERHVQGEYNPTDDEIKKFYEEKKSMFVKPEQVKASHILVAFKEDSTAAGKAKAKTKADELLAKVKGGTDFAEVAKSSSDCPSSKDGGDLGFFSKGQMVKPFEDKAFSLKQGEISDLVQTQFGYHIIKVVDHKAEETIPFDQSKENIVNILKRQEEQKKMENYIKTLYQKAKVKYASGFEPEKKDGLPW